MTGFYLVILSFALMIIEAHAPTFGVLGVAAVVALLAGGKMIVDAGGIFGIPVDWSLFLGIAVSMMGILVLASRIVIKSLKKPPIAGPESMLGHHAIITDWNGQSGHIHIQGELWAARSVHPHPFNVGDAVTVSAIEELVLHIRPKE